MLEELLEWMKTWMNLMNYKWNMYKMMWMVSKRPKVPSIPRLQCFFQWVVKILAFDWTTSVSAHAEWTYKQGATATRHVCCSCHQTKIRLTLTALKYFCINHENYFFPIWNHLKCLSQFFLLHLNTYVMGLRAFTFFNFFRAGPSLDVRFWRLKTVPALKELTNAYIMLAQRLRRWPHTTPAFVQRYVCSSLVFDVACYTNTAQ